GEERNTAHDRVGRWDSRKRRTKTSKAQSAAERHSAGSVPRRRRIDAGKRKWSPAEFTQRGKRFSGNWARAVLAAGLGGSGGRSGCDGTLCDRVRSGTAVHQRRSTRNRAEYLHDRREVGVVWKLDRKYFSPKYSLRAKSRSS